MRALALKPALPEGVDAIDIVGTGGDGSGSLNLSTGAALLAAACGLPVVKHGNRSISSRSGSADLIEAIGFTLPLDENRAAECFVACGFTFLFAPYFHPAMKALAPIRTALGIRTVFNLLGPLTNPAAPRYLLIGAYDAPTAELMAGTLSGTRIERGWVVHGASGWDEATPIGSFLVFDVAGGRVTRREVNPEEFGMARCSPRELKGGDAKTNLKALLDVFEGRDQGPHLRHVGAAIRIGFDDRRACAIHRRRNCPGAGRHRQRQGTGMVAALAGVRASHRCIEEDRMSGFLDEMAALERRARRAGAGR